MRRIPVSPVKGCRLEDVAPVSFFHLVCLVCDCGRVTNVAVCRVTSSPTHHSVHVQPCQDYCCDVRSFLDMFAILLIFISDLYFLHVQIADSISQLYWRLLYFARVFFR